MFLKDNINITHFHINHKLQLESMRENVTVYLGSEFRGAASSSFHILLLSFHICECLLNMLLITDANGTERVTENKYFKVIL